jgi:hypothetical protein
MAESGISRRLVTKAIYTAADAPEVVPVKAGYYAIFIDNAAALPSPFRELLVQRATRLIYIGIANRSPHERLVEQDLRHREPSTFFRGMGAILGYRSVAGSLVS